MEKVCDGWYELVSLMFIDEFSEQITKPILSYCSYSHNLPKNFLGFFFRRWISFREPGPSLSLAVLIPDISFLTIEYLSQYFSNSNKDNNNKDLLTIYSILLFLLIFMLIHRLQISEKIDYSYRHCRVSVSTNKLKSAKKMFCLLQWKPSKNDEKCFLILVKSSLRSQDI